MNKHYNKNLFQGHHRLKHKNYFEGWYYKQVSKNKEFVISFIPGISTNKEDPHAFIQCIFKNINGCMKSLYFRYDLDSFKYEDNPFKITIDDNIFTKTGINIHLRNNSDVISGRLHFNNLTPIKKSLIEPNIMGIFSYVPGLECNHDIVSMNHYISGQLSINKETVIFTGGKGYIEKDWGTSFPKKYIWIQSNHFDCEEMSLSCSIASFPVLNLKIQGFFCILHYNNQAYRFATYNGSKIKMFAVNKKDYNIIMTNKKFSLHLKGKMMSDESLIAPHNGKMSYTIKEGLSGLLRVTLKNSKGDILIDQHSKYCGTEIVGY